MVASTFMLIAGVPFRPRPTSKEGGFTLLELLIVLAIIATLSAIATPAYFQYLEQAKVTAAISSIKTVENRITLYQMDNNRFPDNLSQVGYGGLLDPWGHPYQYLNIADASKGSEIKPRMDRFLVPINSDYDLYSMGEDGSSVAPLTAKMSRDDVVRANDGLFVGLASNY